MRIWLWSFVIYLADNILLVQEARDSLTSWANVSFLSRTWSIQQMIITSTVTESFYVDILLTC